jgi:hypothetical protein
LKARSTPATGRRHTCVLSTPCHNTCVSTHV